MNYLHILSEDDSDDAFYQSCLNKITGKHFELLPSNRIRKAGGISEVLRKLRIFLKEIKYTGRVENTFFLVAVDNDRSPVHPEHSTTADFSKLSKSDQKKSCRRCEIDHVIDSVIGSDRKIWPIQGAVAVPVEMMESWQLLICNADSFESEQVLPIFPERDKRAAKDYYKSSNVPNQLKDLVKAERLRLCLSRSEFQIHCADLLDVNDLMARSPSFSRFVSQVSDWSYSS